MTSTLLGLGLELIDRHMRSELDASIKLQFSTLDFETAIFIPPDTTFFQSARTGMSQSAINTLKILLVEDESLIAMFLEGVLIDAGYDVVGPIGRIEEATEAARAEPILDAGLLDVNLGRSTVFPVADELVRRNIPFVFMTGYGSPGLPERYQDRPVVTKPYTQDMVLDALMKIVQPGSSRLVAAV